MRIIDADELKKQAYRSGDWDKPLVVDVEAIDDAPTVDLWHYPSKGEYPTEDGSYFVACRSPFEGFDSYTEVCNYEVEQERWINFFGYTNPDVYAWMPLPEPPKEEV